MNSRDADIDTGWKPIWEITIGFSRFKLIENRPSLPDVVPILPAAILTLEIGSLV